MRSATVVALLVVRRHRRRARADRARHAACARRASEPAGRAHYGEPYLDVPFLGPLLEISHLRFDDSYEGSNTANGWLAFILATDAAAQIGGFAMLIAGASTTSKQPGAQRLELVPLGAGAAVRGTF